MSKNVVVDSDIVSYFLKGDERVVESWEAHVRAFGFLYLSAVNVFEVLSGLQTINATNKIKKLNEVIEENTVLDVTEDSARISADVYVRLRSIGRISGKDDILIAGIALLHDLRLCTNNEKHYQYIQGLEIVNWKRS
ncbi:MAG: PIN domain-containing protein [Bernardetiaceae bacterium]